MPSRTYELIDRRVDESRFVDVLRKLKQVFYVAHLHFNNWSCMQGIAPFPASAVEILLVNKRIGELDPSGTARLPRPLDAPGAPADLTICSVKAKRSRR